MSGTTLSPDELGDIDDAVKHFVGAIQRYQITAENLANLLQKALQLKPLVHSLRWRVKDPGHLQKKLIRKAVEAKRDGTGRKITKDNLFLEITDLAGLRLLHLHTSQFPSIHNALLDVLGEQNYNVVEGPIAHTWDDEYRALYKGLGVETASRNSLYTSVHYVIDTNSRTPTRCELQVRTLMEEVWGEVSHTINYPAETGSVACQEQLKVLARLTSGCTRLVDSVFRSQEEFLKGK